MANDDHLPLPNDSLEPRPSPSYATNMVERGNGESDGISVSAASAGPAMPDLTTYAHALRRHWFLALGIGLFCAALAGPAVWFGVGAKYTANSLLRVAMQQNLILTPGTDTVNRDFFEIYKNTQTELIRNRLVLIAALRRPEVTNLPCIQEQKDSGDPVDWLEKRLNVTFPSKAEVMLVSLTREDPNEAAVLVRAVVDAYMTEVVDKENSQKLARCLDLVKICDVKESEIRTKREQLKNLVGANGGLSETDVLTQHQKFALEELLLHTQELARMQFEMGKLQADLAGQKALLSKADEANVPASDLDMLIRMDPVANQLATELAMKKMMASDTQLHAKQGVKSAHVTHFTEEVEMLQKQYDDQIAEIEKKARQRTRRVIQMEVVRLESSLLTMQQQQRIAELTIAKMRKAAEEFGTASLDVEMLKLELKRLEVTCSNFNAEREKLEAEQKSTSRITSLQPAEVPLLPSNTGLRLALTGASTLAAMLLPAFLIVLLDIRIRRINTASDVSKGLHLSVIGSVPLIPARVIREMASPSSRYRVWHLRLTESVDGVMARLLRKANLEQCRVIMISSAVGGEGKTTLATQLALSLARTGRSTVLVDFDLRRPAFDEVFGLPLTPGVSESLRRECSVAEMVRETATDCLSVITAGQWDRQALASLSNGGAAVLFDQLREKYEFIVVDTSPILPIADPRFVSQFVDTVILSVFRDISEAPKIQAACDILQAFGVQSIEAVVTGPNVNSYGKHMGYESTITA
jgi:capsular exopolysaccharide synthesis family protein